MCSKIFFLLFLLQRHYFHCKNQFDITNLNSTYTQVSARISSSVVKARWKCVQLRCVYEWQIILITWAMCVCPQMQSKGLYKAMGELNLLFNYIETYLASKRHRNHVWRPADPNQSFFLWTLHSFVLGRLLSVGFCVLWVSPDVEFSWWAFWSDFFFLNGVSSVRTNFQTILRHTHMRL